VVLFKVFRWKEITASLLHTIFKNPARGKNQGVLSQDRMTLTLPVLNPNAEP
jgi:hypothetical protein